jgi:hypothetical protein
MDNVLDLREHLRQAALHPGNGQIITIYDNQDYSEWEAAYEKSLDQCRHGNDQKQGVAPKDVYRLLTATLVKQKYDVTDGFIGKLRQEGLPYFEIRGRRYYRIIDIEAFLLKYRKADI